MQLQLQSGGVKASLFLLLLLGFCNKTILLLSTDLNTILLIIGTLADWSLTFRCFVFSLFDHSSLDLPYTLLSIPFLPPLIYCFFICVFLFFYFSATSSLEQLHYNQHVTTFKFQPLLAPPICKFQLKCHYLSKPTSQLKLKVGLVLMKLF